MLVVRKLYGPKSASSEFEFVLVNCMHHLGYVPCFADTYLWIKAKVQPSNGFDYHS